MFSPPKPKNTGGVNNFATARAPTAIAGAGVGALGGSPSTNTPAAYITGQNYSPTFSGPITANQDFARAARNESMARAAYGGDIRGYLGQSGDGVGAGSKMSAYRSGLLADSEAGKQYAQAQQDLFNQNSELASADLLFQERQAGEQGWLRDLLLDRDDVRTQERKSAYKRRSDVRIGNFQRAVDDAIAAKNREVQMASALI
jgi:hypothetical protein